MASKALILLLPVVGIASAQIPQPRMHDMLLAAQPGAASTAIPLPLTLGTPYAYWTADSITASDGTSVASWTDSGANGLTLSKAGGADPVIKKASTVLWGSNVVYCVNNSCFSNASFSLAQPAEYVMMVSNLSSYITDGVSTTVRQTFWAVSGNFDVAATTTRVMKSVPASGWYVLDVVFTNATGVPVLWTNNVACENLSSSAGTSAQSGLFLSAAYGANSSSVYAGGKHYFAQAVVYSGFLSSSDRSTLYNYFKTNYPNANLP